MLVTPVIESGTGFTETVKGVLGPLQRALETDIVPLYTPTPADEGTKTVMGDDGKAAPVTFTKPALIAAGL